MAFQLPPEVPWLTGGVIVGRHGVDTRQHNVGQPEDRDYREVSVNSTGAVHGRTLSDGEGVEEGLP